MKFLILNGPNMNFLGIREPSVYGTKTYNDLCGMIKEHCESLNIECEFYQSNHEGCLIDKIQNAYGKTDGIIFNPAAYTHTSIALYDALKSVNIPTVEVHISDVNSREEYRKVNFIKNACIASVCGEGLNGYIKAADILKEYLK